MAREVRWMVLKVEGGVLELREKKMDFRKSWGGNVDFFRINMPVTTLEKAHYFLGSARKAGKAIVRRRRSTFRSRLLGFRLAGCFRPCLAPRSNGASGQAEDILVPVWGFPALRPAPVPRLADSFLVLLHFLPLRRLLMCGRSILSGAWTVNGSD